jgi:formylglycine-generating enzyme required for sulfatase activity
LAYFIHEDQRQYLVQEYIEGENLEQELKNQGVFNEAKIRALLADLLPVLGFIHQRGVIHRDIKPENIIRRKQDNKLVLVDFGAAKAITPANRSVTGTVIGSFDYMAPEQGSGKAVNTSDLYSLGVTCLYLLTGISPFELFDIGEHEWCWRDYLVENSVNNDLAKILDKLVIFGTRKRYQEVGEVLGDLGITSSPQRVTQIQPSTPVIYVPATPRIQVASSPQVLTETLPGRIKLELVKIPAGSFTMGSNEDDSEKPPHKVTLKEFYLGKFPVTQKQYQAVMWNNPSKFKAGFLGKKSSQKHPVETVSWNDAKEFCQKLKQITGKDFRLPTEAEWEYACRAGTQTHYYFGDSENQLGEYAWYNENSRSKTHPVGVKKPNAWGLYDMTGNVWEWCEDHWHDNYANKPENIKNNGSITWSDSNEFDHQQRGGSWYSDRSFCRSAYRLVGGADDRYSSIGFRLAFSLP